MMCMLTRGPEENLLSFLSSCSSSLPVHRSKRLIAPLTSSLSSVCHHLTTHGLGTTNISEVDMGVFFNMSACVILLVYLKVVLYFVTLLHCCEQICSKMVSRFFFAKLSCQIFINSVDIRLG